MFKKTKGCLTKQRQKRDTKQDNKQAFYNALHAVEEVLSFNQDKDISLQIGVYDFCIKAFAREIAASSATQIFKPQHFPYSKDFQIPFTECYTEENIKFEGHNIAACVWDPARLLGSVKTVLQSGFRQTYGYYTGLYYEELNLIVITNGLHHTSIASLLDTGSAKVGRIRLADYFGVLKTDGERWYRGEGAERQVSQVGDYRIAVLYELARRRGELAAVGKQVLPQNITVPHELDIMEENYRAIWNEKNYYRNECRLLKTENERLTEQLRKCCNNADI